MRPVVSIAHFALLAVSVYAQSAGTPVVNVPASNAPAADAHPAFVIADVHDSLRRTFTHMEGPILRGDRYLLRQAPMRDLIAIAYGVNPGYVKGGPSWIEDERYDINAKMPPGTTRDKTKLMMGALLEDRFKLVARNEMAPMPANVLTGSWDFTLSFSSPRLAGVGSAAPATEGTVAADPNGAVSFFDAVNKQLGLKLEKQKRPLPVLIIDHINQQPTEN